VCLGVVQDGHEILGYALLLARHDKDLRISGTIDTTSVHIWRPYSLSWTDAVKDVDSDQKSSHLLAEA
jgi:hypothetical protein